MLNEYFMLMRKYNELKEKRNNVVEKYQDNNDNAEEKVVKGLETIMIVIIIISVVMFALYIYAIVDAARNCREQAMLHILLLIFVPAYLPVYFVLRVSGNVCTLQ